MTGHEYDCPLGGGSCPYGGWPSPSRCVVNWLRITPLASSGYRLWQLQRFLEEMVSACDGGAGDG